MSRPWAIRIRLRLPSAGRAYGGLLSGAQGLRAGAWSDRLSPDSSIAPARSAPLARHCPALPQGGRVKRYAGRSIALQGDTLRLPGYLGGPRADGAGPRSLEFRGRGRSGSLRRIVTPTIACTPWSSAWGDLPPSTQRGHRDTSGGSRSRAHESAGRRCRTASSGRRGNRPRSVVRDRRR